jgi:branched-chain amino acid transport system permease protein
MKEKKQAETRLMENEEIKFDLIKKKNTFSNSIKNFFNNIKNKSQVFIEYQLPSAKNDFKSWISSFRGILIIFCLVLVTIVPLLLDRNVFYRVFILAMIYSIYAASWDLLAGITGQVSFGHAAFFGLGGYAVAFLLKFAQMDWFVALILGSFLSIIFGLIIAIPCLRLKGPYLALGTLAFSSLLAHLFSMSALKSVFFGPSGISAILDFIFLDIRIRFIYILIIMMISVVIMLVISNSKLGMLFKAIRDDEKSTKASGVNVVKYKILAFMISTFFAGLAGGIYVLEQTKVDPNIYGALYSFYPVVMTCLGGIGLISGSVFGAYFYFVAIQILKEIIIMFGPAEFIEILITLPTLIFAALLLILVRFTERGLMEPTIENTKTLYELIIGK